MHQAIHLFVEIRTLGKWKYKFKHDDVPFEADFSDILGLAAARNDAGLKPIDAPRGLPADIDPELKEACHELIASKIIKCPTHFTLQELVAHDWDAHRYGEAPGRTPKHVADFGDVSPSDTCTLMVLSLVSTLAEFAKAEDLRLVILFEDGE